MTSALARALAAAAAHAGVRDFGPFVERIAIDRQGRLDIEAELSCVRRWLRWDGALLQELQPDQDKRLRAAARVRAEDVLSWRPGRRIVLATNGPPRAILKGYRRGLSRFAAERHRIASAATRSGGFRVPELIEHDSAREALLLEELVVDPVGLAAHEADSHFRVGMALAGLQEAVVGAELERFGAADELAVLRRLRERVSSACDWLPTGWDGVFAGACRFAERLPQTEDVACHRDLHDGQLSRDADERIALFDFDTLCRADPALDPANLLAHYALRQLQGLRGADAEGVRACSEAVIEGYQPGSCGFWTSLRFYQTTSLLRLALVYALRPRWRAITPDLAAYAGRCLAETATVSELP